MLHYLLVKHFILLFYLGVKCHTKQIKNRTTTFYQQAYKQPWIVPQIALLATNLVLKLQMDQPDIFLLTYKNILLEPLLTTQSNTNPNQSTVFSTNSTVEQVPQLGKLSISCETDSRHYYSSQLCTITGLPSVLSILYTYLFVFLIVILLIYLLTFQYLGLNARG